MEIKSLTGIRGIAAIVVLWYHMQQALVSRGMQFNIPEWLHRLVLNGNHSVDVFFVLSGFILALTYRKWFNTEINWSSYWLFIRRRVARIYPLHFVMLTLTVLAVFAVQLFNIKTYLGLDRFDFGTLPEHYLLVHAWGLTFHGTGDWNPPTWSISIELLAYLLFPVTLFIFGKFNQQRSLLLLSIVVAAGFILNYFMAWDVWGPAGIARGYSEFALGCVTARFTETNFTNWLRSSTGSTVAILALLASFCTTSNTSFLIGACTAPVILALTGNNASARFCAWQPVYFLGEISYSIYIGHTLFMLVIWRIVNPSWMATGLWQFIAGFIAVNLLVIGLSTATYKLIERPGRDWLSDKKVKAA